MKWGRSRPLGPIRTARRPNPTASLYERSGWVRRSYRRGFGDRAPVELLCCFCRTEFDPELDRARMMQFGQDVQGPLPGGPGRPRAAGGIVSVTEAGEALRFVVPVVDLPVHVHSALVAGDHFGEVTKVPVDIADGVPGGGFALPVAELPKQPDRLPAMGQGAPVLPDLGFTPTHQVERPGVSGYVADRPVQIKGVPDAVQRGTVAALMYQGLARRAGCVRLSDVVAESRLDVDGAPSMAIGVLASTQVGVGTGQDAECLRLACPVGQLLCGVQSGGLGGDQILPVSPASQELTGDPHQPPHVPGRSGAGCGRDAR